MVRKTNSITERWTEVRPRMSGYAGRRSAIARAMRTPEINEDASSARWDAKNGFVEEETGITNRLEPNTNTRQVGGSTGQTMDKGTRKKMQDFYYRQNRKAQGLSAG